jgi:hypothetical protein
MFLINHILDVAVLSCTTANKNEIKIKMDKGCTICFMITAKVKS